MTAWLHTQLPDADEVRVEGLDRVNFGHSAEMMVLTVVARHGDRNVVKTWCCVCGPDRLRCWNPTTSRASSTILRGLEDTAVRVPRALWLEETGEVLGRPFFVMERVGGDVYEMESPDAADQTVVRMCESLAEQLAAIHSVDLKRPGWTRSMTVTTTSTANSTAGPSEMHRVKRGSLPALERLLQALRDSKPAAVPAGHPCAWRRQTGQLRVH